MTLELVIGPMFAGKTTHIIKLYDDYIKNKKVLILNHSSDNRYSKEEYICSHLLEKRPCKKINDFNSIENPLNYDVFLIDEIHFFENTNLMTFVKMLLTNKKIVHCFGINGDVELKPFNNVSSLLPYSTNIIMKKSKCFKCDNDAYYHKRTIEVKTQAYVGTGDIYRVYCFNHYHS